MLKKSFSPLKTIACLIIVNVVFFIAGTNQSPSQVISSINQYRSQNGLNSLSTNSTLSYLAQSHAEYQANLGYPTHTGARGTTPKDRAYAAGYGNGNTIFMSEIIYGGTNATVSSALNWWKNSPLHNSVMLDSRYLEIGAGVASGSNGTYFTAELAWVSGYTNPDDESSSDETVDSNPDGIPAAPITKSTPDKNGKIVHTVLTGQSLWSIAAVYEVALDYLQEINNLSPLDYIFPEDKIIIVAGNTPSPTDTPQPTASPLPPTNPPALGEAIFDEIIIPNTVQPPETPFIGIESLPSATDEKRINLQFMLGIVFLLISMAFIAKFINNRDLGEEIITEDILDKYNNE
jgi:uncharacterized protein YkwD